MRATTRPGSVVPYPPNERTDLFWRVHPDTGHVRVSERRRLIVDRWSSSRCPQRCCSNTWVFSPTHGLRSLESCTGAADCHVTTALHRPGHRPCTVAVVDDVPERRSPATSTLAARTLRPHRPVSRSPSAVFLMIHLSEKLGVSWWSVTSGQEWLSPYPQSRERLMYINNYIR